MNKAIQRRIEKRCASGKPVVVVSRKGKASRVYSLESFLKMQKLPHETKPWTQRGGKKAIPDPLGAVEGTVLSEMRREDIYD